MMQTLQNEKVVIPQYSGVKLMFWLCLFFFFCKAYCTTDECKITVATTNKVYITNGSDHIGFCGFVAMRNILHQHRCHNQGSGYSCTAPSVLALAQFELVPPRDPQSPDYWHFIAQQLEAKGLPDEACAPVNGVYPDPTPDEIKATDWLERYNRLNLKIASPYVSEHDQDFIVRGRATESTAPDVIVKVTSILNTALFTAHDRYLQGKMCPYRRFPTLGQFHHTSLRNITLEGNKLFPWTHKLISQGVTGIIFNIYTRMGSGKPTLHAVTIVNVRTRCCSGYCRNQFQTMDDTRLIWSDGQHQEGGWVDESLLVSKMVGQNAGMIEWIAPPYSDNPARNTNTGNTAQRPLPAGQTPGQI